MTMDVYFKYRNSQCTVIKLLITTLRVFISNKMTLLGWKLRKQFVLLKAMHSSSLGFSDTRTTHICIVC